jgi:hypothetical protein
MVVAASAAASSTARFFTRLIPLDSWRILFWRGLFAGLSVAAAALWREWQQVFASARAIGLRSQAAAVCSALATILFITAFRQAPLWVRLAFGDTPPWTLMGGALMIGAIIAQSAYTVVRMQGRRSGA